MVTVNDVIDLAILYDKYYAPRIHHENKPFKEKYIEWRNDSHSLVIELDHEYINIYYGTRPLKFKEPIERLRKEEFDKLKSYFCLVFK